MRTYNTIIKAAAMGLCFAAMVSCNDNNLEGRVDRLEKEVESLSASKLINNPNTANEPSGVDESRPLSEITFQKMEHDFGTITAGEKVSTTFTFTNSGDAPLVIKSATASCGCTVPSYPREPIAPGESSELVVEYNSTGKSGMENKQVTVTANTQPSITRLAIKANVVPQADNQ